MNIETVNELIASMESAGELSIREQNFLKLAKAYQQLSAENVALKNVFSQKEIPSEAVDAFMETAVMDHDWNETSEWSWVENETEVIHAVLDALKPETAATDRIVAEAEARGVEKFIASLPSYADTEVNTYDYGVKAAIETTQTVYGPVFIKQLREGAVDW
ncbi:TPA: hypothetical protein ACXRW3_000591 [Klebsiella quasipneumoniae subsp. quasipneumoniae]|uniref:hypothetical protein n=1 Tax=Klebsiella quasipneumoniae TaxID=1463165 RepID=UPI000E2BA68A|nr:hypothetical protein [Klebsiella quasipneumoniae]SXD37028.1 Uncharacterised protein [Klebsiella quasipneumoniae]